MKKSMTISTAILGSGFYILTCSYRPAGHTVLDSAIVVCLLGVVLAGAEITRRLMPVPKLALIKK